MPLPANHIVTADEFAAANNMVSINGASSVSETTTSGSYASLGSSATSVSFTKRLTSTAIRIDLHATVQPTTAATAVRFAVLINGTDYDVASFVCNSANARDQVSGTAIVASGLAAGTYTVQIRWKRNAGAGTVQRFITDDWQSMTVTEVYT